MSEREGPQQSFADEHHDWFVDLLNRARRGDTQAVGELVQHYRGYLLQVARQDMDARLKSKLSASDLVQESLVNVHEKMGDFRGSSPQEFKVWIRRIIQNEAKNARRKFVHVKSRQVGRETRMNDSALPTPAIADQRNTPGTEALLREKAGAMQTVIEMLPDNYQTVLRLRNWQELPFEEIGREMDLSTDAARKLWYRAIIKLQNLVEKDFPELQSKSIDIEPNE